MIKKNRPRLDQLDALRGMCALVVMMFHYYVQSAFREITFIRNGYLLVDFFFVLSGFVMFYNYRSMKDLGELQRFITLRFFRIYPLHITMLLVFLAYECVQWLAAAYLNVHASSPAFQDNNFFAFLTNIFLLNGIGFMVPTFNTPSWSISAEFFAYIFFGCILFIYVRPRRFPIVWIFLVMSFAAAGLIGFSDSVATLGQLGALSLPRCLYSFFMGTFLCAVIYPDTDKPGRINVATFGFSIGVQSALQVTAIGLAVSGVTFLARQRWELIIPLSFAAVIATLALWPDAIISRWAKTKPMQWLGQHSYSIYMVHMIVLLSVQASLHLVAHLQFSSEADPLDGVAGRINILQLDPRLGTLIGFGCIIAVLLISRYTYRYIELPGQRLGKRIAGVNSVKPITTLDITVETSSSLR